MGDLVKRSSESESWPCGSRGSGWSDEKKKFIELRRDESMPKPLARFDFLNTKGFKYRLCSHVAQLRCQFKYSDSRPQPVVHLIEGARRAI